MRRKAEEQKTLVSLIAVSNLRIRLDELLLLVFFFFRSLFSITVAYPLFQIETSLIALCFELAGLQLHIYVSHFLCSFIFIFLWLQMIKYLNFNVNIAQTWKKCDEKALDLLFYFTVNFVSLFVCSAFASILQISCFCFCSSDWILYSCLFVLLLLLQIPRA